MPEDPTEQRNMADTNGPVVDSLATKFRLWSENQYFQ